MIFYFGGLNCMQNIVRVVQIQTEVLYAKRDQHLQNYEEFFRDKFQSKFETIFIFHVYEIQHSMYHGI
jgi:hypothetical protein